ncbi:hypothetical protein [Bacillus andreraoultii]|uniref:hypothetical protein n=1 Tax=Bacillus andreraoultii TaxID=1499685 RepID=UPI000B223B51|nr:hypothetical protein [Bacillus andreraoultii]
MARGKSFNHKKKNHPGNHPNRDGYVEKRQKEAIGDEELIVTQEQFKNRIQTTDVD